MRSKKSRQIEFGPVFDLPANCYRLLVSLEIDGEPGRKSNQRQIVTNAATGKPMIIKSQKACNYAESFISQVAGDKKLALGSLEEPLALWAKIYYASNRPDLSLELIQDLLQEAGVVANDRFFKQTFAFSAIDRERPRAEIRIYGIWAK